MRQISVRQMRAMIGKLGELVEAEGELIVTRRGVPIAKVVPLGGARRMPSHAALRASMPLLGVPTEALVREDRDGR